MKKVILNYLEFPEFYSAVNLLPYSQAFQVKSLGKDHNKILVPGNNRVIVKKVLCFYYPAKVFIDL